MYIKKENIKEDFNNDNPNINGDFWLQNNKNDKIKFEEKDKLKWQ